MVESAESVLPAYLWPPSSWVAEANRLRVFQIAYPPCLPKGSCFNRYRIQGGRWLTIPILHTLKSSPYEATWPTDKHWRLYHWRTLLTLYGKAPFFYEWKPFLEYLYLQAPFTRLSQFTECVLLEIARLYGWRLSWSERYLGPVQRCSPSELSILDQLLRAGL
ncbi:MAG: WbqC family protein [Bacteroidia bacterium]|nr:WbqC family protein [Bacteroidia bacterium]MDW8015511.1 WbqC family protein [Bacteroidia bacterium]